LENYAGLGGKSFGSVLNTKKEITVERSQEERELTREEFNKLQALRVQTSRSTKRRRSCGVNGHESTRSNKRILILPSFTNLLAQGIERM